MGGLLDRTPRLLDQQGEAVLVTILLFLLVIALVGLRITGQYLVKYVDPKDLF